MKEALKSPKVVDVGVAIVQEENEEKEKVFNVYLINQKTVDLESCLVTSKGYGKNIKSGEEIKTSTLRHFLETIPARSFVKIEPIIENVFGLNNEYWVSFWVEKQLFDKKYVFLPEVVNEKNFIKVPLIHKKGIFIK